MTAAMILALLIKNGPAVYEAVMKLRETLSETDRTAFDQILADGDAAVSEAAARLAAS